jgi:hypothetical protein
VQRLPGQRHHFGSGLRANRIACSASERNALLISSDTPAARAAAIIRSKACATSGRMPLPWRMANGPP